jgi:hypothetical protein
VPPLITATELEAWSGTRHAQAHLPTLVRRLVMATVVPSSVRFPAAEGVSAPGFDGVVEVDGSASPFVPAGRSVWELGTGASRGGPSSKAEDDYSKRTRQTPDEERARTTFMFVTSRAWSGAAEWARRKASSEDGWAGVAALDAQDLAAWLAGCPGVHGWLEEEALGRRPYGVEGLRDWFRRWAERTEPAIPAELLLAGRDHDAAELVAALSGPAGEHLLSARAQEEALAFAAAGLLANPPTPAADSTAATGDAAAGAAAVDMDVVLSEAAAPGAAAGATDAAAREALLERALVVHDESAWRQWAVHDSPLVLLPSFTEPDVDGAVRRGHHVVLRRAARPADRVLAPLRRDRAREVWERAGVPFPQADELARASGRSLTSLRRRIGRAGRFRRPAWADGPAANLLAPLMLAGGWRDDVSGDLNVVVELADRNAWRGVARDLAPLAAGEDAPVVQDEHRWEFVDILDAWDALSAALTAEDLEIFQNQALDVLGEPDPAEGLAADERRRLALTVDGVPRRSRSGTLRRGMATTLAVLGSVVGDRVLPGGSTGQDRASLTVRSLLHDADAGRWTAIADLLPLLAEASPAAFLDALERSLEQLDPPVMALFAEADDPLGLAPTSRHSALLWALEALAFSPRHLSRVAVALARLARLDPGGRLANRPTESLAAVLHPVLPQGAADEAGRMAVVDAVRRAVPDTGWTLMLSLVKNSGSGMLIRQGPRYREWRREAPAPTFGDVARTLTALAERIAQDTADAQDRWGAALSVVDKVPPAGREAILAAADRSLPALPDDAKRAALAALAERVERHARFRDAAWALDDETVSRLQAFLAEYAVPGNASDDYALFTWWPRRQGLDPGTEQGRTALAAAREQAVARALVDGPAGLRRLAEQAELPETIGDTVARLTADHDDELLPHLAEDGSQAQRLGQGLVRVRQADRAWLRRAVAERPAIAVELLLAADLDDDLLRLLDDTDPAVRNQYWRRVPPWRVPDALVTPVAETLLAHDRPYSAMYVLHDAARAGALPADLTVRAMTAPAAGTAESLVAIHSPQYVIGELLGALESAGASSEDLAQIEWLYLPLLRDERAPEALHRRLAAEPAFFAEIVCAVYRRRIDDEDEGDERAAGPDGAPTGPPGERERPEAEAEATGEDAGGEEPGEEVAPHVAEAAWELLHGWRAPLPGSAGGQPPTGDQVSQWVREAKRLLAAAGRGEIASVIIGEALSGPAADPEGTWPSLPVRDALEREQDRRLEEGLAIGRFNQRGVTMRGPYEGGVQERRLEAQYRRWADAVREAWPRSGALLDGLADGYAADARREDESAARDR